MNEVAHGVGGFVALLGAAVLIAILAERVRVPAAVALVAIGAFFQIARANPGRAANAGRG